MGAHNGASATGGRSRGRRTTVVLASVLLLVVVGAGLLYMKFSGNLDSVDVDGMLGDDRPEKVATGAQDILVLGSDTRSGDNGRYGRDEGSARSDTAMVLHIAEGRKSAQLVSIPRDTLVDRPACTTEDGETTQAANGVMFNSAYQVGGPACAMKTVEGMSGVRLDHFVEVDFTGFKKLIDAVGGVPMDIPQDIDDEDSHLQISKGRHTLDGEQALGVVRTRHGYGDGSDLGRIQLQQQFVKALMAQVKDIGVLTNPKKLYDVADTATKAVTTDEGLGSLPKLTSFGKSVSSIGPDKLDAVTLPVGPSATDPNRVVVKEQEADALWQAVRTDSPLPKQASPSPSETNAPR